MSTLEQTNRDRAIVIHPPVSEDVPTVADADVIRERDVTTVILGTAPVAGEQSRPAAEQQPVPQLQRVIGLDTFRGLFILLMTLSMAIPLEAQLGIPQWMYHMQFPAPGDFVSRAGLTWPDLVFPGFLLAMCAAIPLANAPRLARGEPYPAIIWSALKRLAMLLVFALIIGHVLPIYTGDFTKRGNYMGLAGFAVCWMIFLRKPDSWSERTYGNIKKIGWLACALLLLVAPALWNGSFAFTRNDSIIRALAVVSLASAVIWLFTRNYPRARFAVFALVLALKLASDLQLPGGGFWMAVTPDILVDAWMLELLLIGIPGLAAGDAVLESMRGRQRDLTGRWSHGRAAALATIILLFVPIAMVGYYHRAVALTAAAIVILATVAFVLSRDARSAMEKAIVTLIQWTCALLLLGAALEPVAGGIQKNPQTVGYLLVTGGVCLAVLTFVIIVADLLLMGTRASRTLTAVGRNPLLAYVAFTMFLNNVAWLTVFPQWRPSTAWEGVGVAFVFTAATGALVAVTAKKKLLWKA